MSRLAEYQAGPPPPTIEGDERFVGVNMKQKPWLLPPGQAQYAENKRFQTGDGADRPGTRTPVFANALNLPNLKGSGVFSNPNGREIALLAIHDTVVAIRSGTTAQLIATEVNPTGHIEFAQQFDKVLLHSDDPDLPVMQWDGLSLDGFVLTEASKALGDGIEIIPNVPWSINFLGRAWFPVGDGMGASDINDYTVWDSILHLFRINAGTADELVGAYPIGNSLIIGKRRSFDILGPIPGDLGDSFINAIALGLAPSSAPPPSMNVIPGPKGVGIKARKAVLFRSGELQFLSDAGGGGIYRLTSAGIDPTPVSDDIQPLFARINWQAAASAVAEMDGIFAVWMVPIDGATFNNAAFVQNTVTGQWMGLDLWYARAHTGRAGRIDPPIPNPLRADNLLGFGYYGKRRIYAINHLTGRVYLLYEGREDQLAPASNFGNEKQTFPVKSRLDTRCYAQLGWGATSARDVQRMEMPLLTYDANVIITQVLEGVKNETPAGTFKPDRSQYTNLGPAPYAVGNAQDDFLAPHREDYAINCADEFQPGAPVPVEVEQEHTERISLSRQGRYVSFRIENDGGSCAVVSVVAETQGTQRAERKGA